LTKLNLCANCLYILDYLNLNLIIDNLMLI